MGTDAMQTCDGFVQQVHVVSVRSGSFCWLRGGCMRWCASAGFYATVKRTHALVCMGAQARGRFTPQTHR
eukprot:10528362-Alexandrium_andersonii.AAC.1